MFSKCRCRDSNSGIPNHAFYIAATKIGGYAWETLGKVWYRSLLRLGSTADFAEFAKETIDETGRQLGEGSKKHNAVKEGWETVGVKPS
jgi:Zn-dependent metalloprotease